MGYGIYNFNRAYYNRLRYLGTQSDNLRATQECDPLGNDKCLRQKEAEDREGEVSGSPAVSNLPTEQPNVPVFPEKLIGLINRAFYDI